jgi:hypothetical protein
MTNIELHALDAIAANLPRIAAALERTAAALERTAALNEGHLEVCREMLEMDRADRRDLSPDVDFTAPSGGVPEAQKSRRQETKPSPANLEGTR